WIALPVCSFNVAIIAPTCI
ncbi:unnamed protein product, partial [Leptidea sinapis]